MKIKVLSMSKQECYLKPIHYPERLDGAGASEARPAFPTFGSQQKGASLQRGTGLLSMKCPVAADRGRALGSSGVPPVMSQNQCRPKSSGLRPAVATVYPGPEVSPSAQKLAPGSS